MKILKSFVFIATFVSIALSASHLEAMESATSKSSVPNAYLQTINHFSSIFPEEINAHIHTDLYCLAEGIYQELLDHAEKAKGAIKTVNNFINRVNNLKNQRLIIRTDDDNFELGECMEYSSEKSKNLFELSTIEQFLTIINELSVSWGQALATNLLGNCLIKADYKWNDLIHIFDYACDHKFVNAVTLIIITFGLDVLAIHDNHGHRALHRAAARNSAAGVTTLIQAVRQLNDPLFTIWHLLTMSGALMQESALFRASTMGHTEAVNIIITAAGERACELIMNDDNEYHRKMLNNAANNGHVEIVRSLLAAVGDRAWELALDSNALGSAASNGQAEVLDIFAQFFGEKVYGLMTIKDSQGWTCLHSAVFNGTIKAVEKLLAMADNNVHDFVAIKNNAGLPAINYSTYPNNTPAITEMLKNVLNRG